MTVPSEIIARIEAAKTQADYAACHAELKAWLARRRAASSHYYSGPNGASISTNGTALCMWLEQIKLNGLTDHYQECVADTLRLFKRALEERHD